MARAPRSVCQRRVAYPAVCAGAPGLRLEGRPRLASSLALALQARTPPPEPRHRPLAERGLVGSGWRTKRETSGPRGEPSESVRVGGGALPGKCTGFDWSRFPRFPRSGSHSSVTLIRREAAWRGNLVEDTKGGAPGWRGEVRTPAGHLSPPPTLPCPPRRPTAADGISVLATSPRAAAPATAATLGPGGPGRRA